MICRGISFKFFNGKMRSEKRIYVNFVLVIFLLILTQSSLFCPFFHFVFGIFFQITIDFFDKPSLGWNLATVPRGDPVSTNEKTFSSSGWMTKCVFRFLCDVEWQHLRECRRQ